MNCFQILYIRSLNTISISLSIWIICCELLSDFVYSFFEHNTKSGSRRRKDVVNCFQILYIRSLNTISISLSIWIICCELLSDFVYSFFEHNISVLYLNNGIVVNCFQILYIRSLNTIQFHVSNHQPSCELLSDFVYSFFEHNKDSQINEIIAVVNCFQILYIRSLNTMTYEHYKH